MKFTNANDFTGNPGNPMQILDPVLVSAIVHRAALEGLV
jgi:hypothetical protein